MGHHGNLGLVFLVVFLILSFVSCDDETTEDAPFEPGGFVADSTQKVPSLPNLDVSPNKEILTGTLRIRILDSQAGSRRQHQLWTAAGERIILQLSTIPALKTGTKVEISGFRNDLGYFTVLSLKGLDRHLYRLDAPLRREPMVHRTAVLAMQEANITSKEALEIFNGPSNSLQHFYKEVSQGIDTFANAVFRKYDISYTDKDCLWDNAYNISDALIAAFEKEGNSVSDYDHIACVVPRQCGSDWSGAWSDLGGITDNGALKFELISMYKDNAFDPWYLAHELGHSLGMDHSRSIDCGAALYNPGADGCTIDEYGNFNDPMGWGEGVYFSAPFQRYLGWIAPSTVLTAAKSDTFNLQPADGEMCGIRAVRIPIPGEGGSYFYVEYRRARTDSHYAGTGEVGDFPPPTESRSAHSFPRWKRGKYLVTGGSGGARNLELRGCHRGDSLRPRQRSGHQGHIGRGHICSGASRNAWRQPAQTR